MNKYNKWLGFSLLFFLFACSNQPDSIRERLDFNSEWQFSLGDNPEWFNPDFDDASWRTLNLPHDWSIEGAFSEEHPAGVAGGALPTGIGWYRKSFELPSVDSTRKVYIDFDGVYRNSEVWINGKYLGKRPYGYSSFRYDLTPFLLFEGQKNVLAVKVDNSLQPNSRWYTGSGIYRNVWLVKTGKTHVDHWGMFVTTPEVSEEEATVEVEVSLLSIPDEEKQIQLKTRIFDPEGKELTLAEASVTYPRDKTVTQQLQLPNPRLWSIDQPELYSAVTQVFVDGKLTDNYETTFGIRTFRFDPEKGFYLNRESVKLYGVNQHHDLGALGAVVNTRATERQLEILKDMGCNAIRTAHNPPSPEFLDLCDEMGFVVMDEAFDQWAKKKNKYDYNVNWKEWHEADLADMVKRDRNHPSIIMWSIGNEIREQFDSTGTTITKKLTDIVKNLDNTRLVTCGLTEQDPEKNFIYQSGALDVLSFNYKHMEYLDFPKNYPGEAMLASENMSALSTRGHYDMPSDEDRLWPPGHKKEFDGNPDYTVSSYDHVYAYWGSTHEDTWKVVSENDFVAGMFIWSGFDFLGEPVPYEWPARSSYYGIIDLCGFPKDVYYLYQSLWTDDPVLHVFPHWNWEPDKVVDVWAYYNHADEVELFLNGDSLGKKSKEDGTYHVMWRVNYEPGTLRAVTYKDGQQVLEKTIHTAGKAAKIELTADRSTINANGKDLSFITVKILDENGNLVTDADNLVHFDVSGAGTIAGVDNGYQASMESFKADHRKAFNGMCLLIVQSDGNSGEINIEANSEGLESSSLIITTN